jgi:ribosomal protein S18
VDVPLARLFRREGCRQPLPILLRSRYLSCRSLITSMTYMFRELIHIYIPYTQAYTHAHILMHCSCLLSTLDHLKYSCYILDASAGRYRPIDLSAQRPTTTKIFRSKKHAFISSRNTSAVPRVTDVELLSLFIDPFGKIRSRRYTRATALRQRKLAKVTFSVL